MNREQMIAWLTLEGWEPNGRNEYWWYGMNRDGWDIYWDENHQWIGRMRIDKPNNRPICEWDAVPANIVSKLFKYIEEKDHGKLE